MYWALYNEPVAISNLDGTELTTTYFFNSVLLRMNRLIWI